MNMVNLWKLSEKFQQLFEELEENGGDLTPEFESKLNAIEEDRNNFTKSITDCIKSLECECDCITTEQQRLKELYERKQNTIKALKKTLLNVVKQYGDDKPSGTKYIAWETGEVSIRKTNAVEVNEELVDKIGNIIVDNITFNKLANTLTAEDNLDAGFIMQKLCSEDIEITDEDLDNMTVNISSIIPVRDLINGKGFNIIKDIATYSDYYKLTPKVSKTDVKQVLKDGTSLNIADIVEHENIQIK